ncbi:GNAT family N-acetyltransferase [Paludibacterium sp. B53371]|uniref:GNAT family N-acetyltransferase n=1 Tax=Paludibacterium sp. B53371 TaxID=2806263 RepID=UPI001C047B7B|nr:GNAT family N-acetyltransferase [Paludibacterium sp. B53371]
MIITPATSSDWPALEQLFLHTRLATFYWQTPAQLKADNLRQQSEGEAIWLARDATGQLCGFISVWQPDHFIHHLYVAPGHQGQGIGRLLLQSLPDWGRQRYTLKCLQQNLAARAFYDRQGFVQLARGEGPDGAYCLLAHEGRGSMMYDRKTADTMDISPATSAERSAVQAFYTLVGYNGSLRETDLIMVARLHGQLVGAVRLCLEQQTMVLRGMQIHPLHQQQGIGARLLGACIPHLQLATAYCLPYAHLRNFYGHAGFETVSASELPPFLAERLTDCLAQGEPLIAMRRHPSTHR